MNLYHAPRRLSIVARAAELTVEMPAVTGYNIGVNERLRITMTMTIYHGSQNEIQSPRFGFGAADNDTETRRNYTTPEVIF
jgi:hypothetical protein